MKKFFLASVPVIFMAVAVSAQSEVKMVKTDLNQLGNEEKTIKNEKKEEKKVLRKLKNNVVSYQTKQAFYSDFGQNSDVTWTKGDYFDEATFTKGGQKKTAYYDFDESLVGTIMNIDFSALPAKAQDFINDKYNGYNIEDVVFFNDNQNNYSDMGLYGDPTEDEDSYFVVLHKEGQTIILHADMNGDVDFLKSI